MRFESFNKKYEKTKKKKTSIYTNDDEVRVIVDKFDENGNRIEYEDTILSSSDYLTGIFCFSKKLDYCTVEVKDRKYICKYTDINLQYAKTKLRKYPDSLQKIEEFFNSINFPLLDCITFDMSIEFYLSITEKINLLKQIKDYNDYILDEEPRRIIISASWNTPIIGQYRTNFVKYIGEGITNHLNEKFEIKDFSIFNFNCIHCIFEGDKIDTTYLYHNSNGSNTLQKQHIIYDPKLSIRPETVLLESLDIYNSEFYYDITVNYNITEYNCCGKNPYITIKEYNVSNNWITNFIYIDMNKPTNRYYIHYSEDECIVVMDGKEKIISTFKQLFKNDHMITYIFKPERLCFVCYEHITKFYPDTTTKPIVSEWNKNAYSINMKGTKYSSKYICNDKYDKEGNLIFRSQYKDDQIIFQKNVFRTANTIREIGFSELSIYNYQDLIELAAKATKNKTINKDSESEK